MDADMKTGKPITLMHSINEFAAVLSHSTITNNTDVFPVELGVGSILTLLTHCRDHNGVVYIIGNGGSAAIASHAVIDFLNAAKMRAHALLDSSVTTCISNDYGYEYIYEKQLIQFIEKNDVLIAISSSGQSKNIINAANIAKKKSAKTITLSGFSENNPLRQMGNYNVWLNTKDYGQVEIGHAFILH